MTWLEEYFDGHQTGPGIWKWRHYFPIYERHLSRFRGKEVHVVEIGVYSGGSIGMWQSYFGEGARIYGVDISPECRAYEGDGVQIFIGDQADKSFWNEFLDRVPRIDVVIDDGGHQPFQQIATLEALLPAMKPGGVYICEDVTGEFSGFWDYLFGLSRNLNTRNRKTVKGSGIRRPSFLQQAVDGVHIYPFMAVIERRDHTLEHLVAARAGTEWQPDEFWEATAKAVDPKNWPIPSS